MPTTSRCTRFIYGLGRWSHSDHLAIFEGRSPVARDLVECFDHPPEYAPLLAHLSAVLENGDCRCPTLRPAVARDVTDPQRGALHVASAPEKRLDLREDRQSG